MATRASVDLVCRRALRFHECESVARRGVVGSRPKICLPSTHTRRAAGAAASAVLSHTISLFLLCQPDNCGPIIWLKMIGNLTFILAHLARLCTASRANVVCALGSAHLLLQCQASVGLSAFARCQTTLPNGKNAIICVV